MNKVTIDHEGNLHAAYWGREGEIIGALSSLSNTNVEEIVIGGRPMGRLSACTPFEVLCGNKKITKLQYSCYSLGKKEEAEKISSFLKGMNLSVISLTTVLHINEDVTQYLQEQHPTIKWTFDRFVVDIVDLMGGINLAEGDDSTSKMQNLIVNFGGVPGEQTLVDVLHVATPPLGGVVNFNGGIQDITDQLGFVPGLCFYQTINWYMQQGLRMKKNS